MPGNPPASASSSHGASNANSELLADGKKVTVFISILFNIFQIEFKLTLFQQIFQHLINPYSIIVVSSDALSNDDYLPDLVGEVEPDGNEIR